MGGACACSTATRTRSTREAVNQVLDYNENAEHDDMPDSLASAIRAYGQRPQIRGFKEGGVT